MDNQISTGTQPLGQTDFDLINSLFAELKSIFPAWRNAFKSQDEVDRVKQAWTKAFIEAKVKDWSYIEGGLKVARRSDTDFIPSVGKFLKWCKDEQTFDVPSVEDSLHEAVHHIGQYSHKWSHPVVYDAAIRCGSHNLKSLKAEKLDRTFKYCYDKAVEAYLSGSKMATPPHQKQLPEPVPLDREAADVYIQKMKKMVAPS